MLDAYRGGQWRIVVAIVLVKDRFNSQLAGDLPGSVPTHPIGNGKQPPAILDHRTGFRHIRHSPCILVQCAAQSGIRVSCNSQA